MTQLNQYLSAQGAMTAKALADEVGVSQPYITDLRYARRFASQDVAAKIEAATGGKVKAETLIRAAREEA